MGLYSVGGQDAGSIATGDPMGHLWNPHSTLRLWLVGYSWVHKSTTAEEFGLCRTTARGSEVTTVTPDIDNAWERDLAPPSGAVLDLNWSVIPTADASRLLRTNVSAGQTGGGTTAQDWVFRWPGICVPPGTGIMTICENGGITGSDHTFTWFEPT